MQEEAEEEVHEEEEEEEEEEEAISFLYFWIQKAWESDCARDAHTLGTRSLEPWWVSYCYTRVNLSIVCYMV